MTDERVAQFVGGRVGSVIYPPYTAMGLEREGRIVAGAVFNCFTGFDIEVTVAGEPGAFTKTFIREAGRYVFETAGCLRMSITTHQPHVIEIAKRLGAQTEGRKRNLFGKGRDGIVLGILKEDWKL